MYICQYIYIHIYIYTYCIYTYIHIYIYSYIHAHKHRWKSECSRASGKLCGGREWGPWQARWGDVVFWAEAEPLSCFGHPTTSMIPASTGCFQESFVGTEEDDPCRQPLPYVCKTEPELVCAAGYYSSTGKQLKASYPSSLRPHTSVPYALIRRDATRAQASSLRPHTQLA